MLITAMPMACALMASVRATWAIVVRPATQRFVLMHASVAQIAMCDYVSIIARDVGFAFKGRVLARMSLPVQIAPCMHLVWSHAMKHVKRTSNRRSANFVWVNA